MQKLESLRIAIESLDAEIIQKIANRERLVQEVARFKAEHKVAVLDEHREAQLQALHKNLCLQYQLDPDYIQEVFEVILRHSRRVQEALISRI